MWTQWTPLEILTLHKPIGFRLLENSSFHSFVSFSLDREEKEKKKREREREKRGEREERERGERRERYSLKALGEYYGKHAVNNNLLTM